jgi:hypothetical protein
VEPISIVTGVIGIGDRVYKLAKNVKDHEIKHKLDEIGDELRDLKQSASKLEDENRELREKLRFKSEDYDFRDPFWYDKAHPRPSPLREVSREACRWAGGRVGRPSTQTLPRLRRDHQSAQSPVAATTCAAVLKSAETFGATRAVEPARERWAPRESYSRQGR